MPEAASSDMAGERLELLDKTFGIATKAGLLALVAWVVLSLAFCSDDHLRRSRQWADGRLRLIDVKLKEVKLAGATVDFSTATALGIDADAAKGLLADLRHIATEVKSPQATARLTQATAQVEAIAGTLAERGERAVGALAAQAESLPAQSGPVEAWIYLGRRSEQDRWAPMSDRISLSGPQQTPRITAEKDVVLVDRDPRQGDVPPGEAAGAVRLVRQGTRDITTKQLVQTTSIGNAKLIWAEVSVPSANVVESGRR